MTSVVTPRGHWGGAATVMVNSLGPSESIDMDFIKISNFVESRRVESIRKGRK
jgi:hypothetical protein